MSLRVLHLASVNYLLKREYENAIYPDPLALINVEDLLRLGEHEAISFLEQVLVEFTDYNPVDGLAIRTAVSSEQESIYKRPFRLHLKSKEHRRNAVSAYETLSIFVQQNPNMKSDDAWLILGMWIPELVSGNVCSDVNWPDEVIMEVAGGPLAPLNLGEITNPETWVLRRKTERIFCRLGSNSPVLQQFIGKEIDMEKIKQIMTFAAKRPCILEFVYGYLKKAQDFAPVIIDVRVLPNIEWDFCETKAVWKVADNKDFFQKLSWLSFIAARYERLIENERFALVTSPKGSVFGNSSRKIGLRSLFEIEIFSPDFRTFAAPSLP